MEKFDIGAIVVVNENLEKKGENLLSIGRTTNDSHLLPVLACKGNWSAEMIYKVYFYNKEDFSLRLELECTNKRKAQFRFIM